MEDTCPRLKSMGRTNAGNLEAAEPIRSEAVLALEAVVVLGAVVDAFQRLGSAKMRKCFWCTRKRRNRSKQELKAAGEC